MPDSRLKPPTRLEDLEVEEVSIVGVPANKRRFLTVKSEDGMPQRGLEIVDDGNGNLVTNQGTAEPSVTGINTGPIATLPLEKQTYSISEIFKATGQNFEILEKRLSIDPELRRLVFSEIGDVMGRLNSVISSADMAQTDRGDKPSTLIPVLANELMEVAKVIGGVAKKLQGGNVKKDADDIDDIEQIDDNSGVEDTFKIFLENLAFELEKAVWSTAMINDFPDSSFLYIKPGGKKDEGGKTVPRSNRMFPVKDASGAYDLPHIRNAIARAPQAKLSPELKPKIQNKAKALLQQAKDGKLKLTAAKAGAKMSKERMAEFEKAITLLGKILGEIRGVNMSKSVPEPVVQGNYSVEELFSNFATKIEGIAENLKKNTCASTQIPETRNSSNSIPVEKSGYETTSTDDDVHWPMDMNNEKSRESVDKSVSFF